MSGAADRVRLDVWLWRARFFKTRTLAAKAVADGAVRVSRNGASRAASKPAEAVGPGDGLSVRVAGRVRTVELLALGVRRGPPAEARALYRSFDDPGGEDDGDGAEEGEGAEG